MSTMLYPVGPLPPRVYWFRRLVVLGVPLILILIIAVSCGGGGKKHPSAATGGTGTNPTATPTVSASSDPNAPCVAGDLSAQLSTDAEAGVYHPGASPVFTATITNVSLSPCTFTSTPANETWTVITGVDKFWTTAGCPAQGTSSSKVLPPGASHRISITWDGNRLDPGCKSGSEAAVGTYRLHARLDGVKARGVVFYIHNA